MQTGSHPTVLGSCQTADMGTTTGGSMTSRSRSSGRQGRAWAIVTVVVLRRPPNHLFVGSSCATLASNEEQAITPGLVGRAIPRELLAQLGALEDTPGPTLGGKLQASQARASPPLQILAYSSSVGACNYCRCEQPVGSTMPPWEQTRWWQGRYTMTSNDCGCGWPGRLARGLKEVLPSANYHVTNHGRFRDPRAPMAVALLTSLYFITHHHPLPLSSVIIPTTVIIATVIIPTTSFRPHG